MASAEAVARLARAAYESSQLLEVADRIDALRAVAAALTRHKDEVLAANARDVEVLARNEKDV